MGFNQSFTEMCRYNKTSYCVTYFELKSNDAGKENTQARLHLQK